MLRDSSDEDEGGGYDGRAVGQQPVSDDLFLSLASLSSSSMRSSSDLNTKPFRNDIQSNSNFQSTTSIAFECQFAPPTDEIIESRLFLRLVQKFTYSANLSIE